MISNRMYFLINSEIVPKHDYGKILRELLAHKETAPLIVFDGFTDHEMGRERTQRINLSMT